MINQLCIKSQGSMKQGPILEYCKSSACLETLPKSLKDSFCNFSLMQMKITVIYANPSCMNLSCSLTFRSQLRQGDWISFRVGIFSGQTSMSVSKSGLTLQIVSLMCLWFWSFVKKKKKALCKKHSKHQLQSQTGYQEWECEEKKMEFRF